MIEPLLRTQLEPVARRQRQWRVSRALLVAWALFAVVGFALLAFQRERGWTPQVTVPLFVILGLVTTLVVTQSRKPPSVYFIILPLCTRFTLLR